MCVLCLFVCPKAFESGTQQYIFDVSMDYFGIEICQHCGSHNVDIFTLAYVKIQESGNNQSKGKTNTQDVWIQGSKKGQTQPIPVMFLLSCIQGNLLSFSMFFWFFWFRVFLLFCFTFVFLFFTFFLIFLFFYFSFTFQKILISN